MHWCRALERKRISAWNCTNVSQHGRPEIKTYIRLAHRSQTCPEFNIHQLFAFSPFALIFGHDNKLACSCEMPSSPPSKVAIIGAGLSGLSFALALHKFGIPSTIWEVRSNGFVQGGAIMLSPNALRILDAIGVYERIRNKGFHFQTLTFKDEHDETTDVYYFGHEQLYGYKAFRVYRQILIDELKLMLEERGIEIKYERKFTHIVVETSEKVEFAFEDGSISTASLLIGADGIHSTLRKALYPTVQPKYLGFVGMTSAMQTSKLRFPRDNPNYPLPVAIAGKPGAFVIAPQDVDGSEVLIGTQGAFPEQDRAGWSNLQADKDEVVRIFSQDTKSWPELVQSAIENIDKDTINTWPYYAVPRLDKWASASGKIIILGDAAHAVPPTTGQGVNQAFEDVWMLGLLLKDLGEGVELENALEFWQRWRQERVDGILDLTKAMNNKRLPLAEQRKLPKGHVWSGSVEDTEQMGWLYGPDLEDVVGKWVEGQRK